LNARIKADALGIKTADYEASKINFDELYRGWRSIKADDEMLYLLQSQGQIPWEDAFPNEYFLFEAGNDKFYGRYNSKEKCVRLLSEEVIDCAPWNIRAMNPQQVFALDALLDEEIRLVTLVGKAGTGKTLLALAAGLQKTIDDLAYKRILVSRPIMPMGRDIGFLPGSKDEKLSHWMQPVFDNLSFIFDNSVTDGLPSDHLEFLMKNEKISLEALTYIRGRSIAHQWLIVDEAQNLTPHEIKTIITRVGKGTKIVLTGDPYQIDNPYLDPSSNGLTVVVERFKGQKIFGNLVLHASERSHLSSLAAELL
jgi:PhoH-like ATPase